MLFKGTSLAEFQSRFKEDKDCFSYLSELKWSKGFQCRRCAHKKCRTGNKALHKRCLSCGYEESPTSGTLFHKLKFPILKAFYICYRVSVSKKGMSSMELCRELNLRQKTCWAFKHKVQIAMSSSGKFPLSGKVEADEFAVGGKEKKKQGRSKGSKKLVAVAVEKKENKKMGRAYAVVIKDYSADEIGKVLNKHVSKKAKISTDGWTAYESLKQNWSIIQKKSKNGKNFPELHTLIMNFKGWLRGIYHKCSEQHMQQYLDEFFFRFNRRGFESCIFQKLMERMLSHKPIYQKEFAI